MLLFLRPILPYLIAAGVLIGGFFWYTNKIEDDAVERTTIHFQEQQRVQELETYNEVVRQSSRAERSPDAVAADRWLRSFGEAARKQ